MFRKQDRVDLSLCGTGDTKKAEIYKKHNTETKGRIKGKPLMLWTFLLKSRHYTTGKSSFCERRVLPIELTS